VTENEVDICGELAVLYAVRVGKARRARTCAYDHADVILPSSLRQRTVIYLLLRIS